MRLASILSRLLLCGVSFLVANRPLCAQEPSLFPDPEPLTNNVSLRDLATALRQQRPQEAAQLTFQLLATMAKAKERGLGQSEFLADRYRSERLSPAEASSVQRCLLPNWALAVRYGLFTADNLALMERGESPTITQGPKRGGRGTFQVETAATPPTLTLTLVPSARNSPPGNLISVFAPASTPIPVPALPKADAVPEYVLKTVEVRLGARTNLDTLGLQDYDLRLDRVERDRFVSFLIEDRNAIHYRQTPVWNAVENRYFNQRERVDNAARTVNFLPQKIPGTNTLGVKLGSFGFVTIYLDENLGAQVTYRLFFRFPERMLHLDEMTPEERKSYEYAPAGTFRAPNPVPQRP